MKHVLIIEDEPVIAEALAYLLARDGLNAEIVADGAEGLTRIRNRRPDLAILDVMLPGMGGMEVLETLRADPDLATLPVLMLTAKGQRRDRDAAEAAGASLFMTKPFSNAELMENVRALLT